jgi:hypothetical protein
MGYVTNTADFLDPIRLIGKLACCPGRFLNKFSYTTFVSPGTYKRVISFLLRLASSKLRSFKVKIFSFLPSNLLKCVRRFVCNEVFEVRNRRINTIYQLPKSHHQLPGQSSFSFQSLPVYIMSSGNTIFCFTHPPTKCTTHNLQTSSNIRTKYKYMSLYKTSSFSDSLTLHLQLNLKRTGIAQWYSDELRVGWSEVQVPAGAARNFSIHYRVQTGSGAHPGSCPMGSRGSFPRGKVAEAWSWPLINI